MTEPPLLILGVRRSGTTLLRVVLDRSAELALPDESYFIPQLADRHRGRIEVEEFVDDLRRIPTLREWDVPVDEVRARLTEGMTVGAAISAVYETYAAQHGKARWGDKTPMYMDHLPLLERLFPQARYVHLIRDGRDTAVSFLAMPRGIVTESWGHPRDVRGVACQWRTEVEAARALGDRVGERYLEVLYEELVAEPVAVVERISGFAGLAFEPAMLEYAQEVDVSAKPHQQRLRQAPTPGVRNWRSDMGPDDVVAFEAIAGDLLAELDYETVTTLSGMDRARARIALASYRARTGAWRAAGWGVRRSPLWRRRHPVLG